MEKICQLLIQNRKVMMHMKYNCIIVNVNDEEVTVKLIGGDLKILCKKDGTMIKTGPAEFIYDGILSDDVLSK